MPVVARCGCHVQPCVCKVSERRCTLSYVYSPGSGPQAPSTKHSTLNTKQNFTCTVQDLRPARPGKQAIVQGGAGPAKIRTTRSRGGAGTWLRPRTSPAGAPQMQREKRGRSVAASWTPRAGDTNAQGQRQATHEPPCQLSPPRFLRPFAHWPSAHRLRGGTPRTPRAPRMLVGSRDSLARRSTLLHAHPHPGKAPPSRRSLAGRPPQDAPCAASAPPRSRKRPPNARRRLAWRLARLHARMMLLAPLTSA